MAGWQMNYTCTYHWPHRDPLDPVLASKHPLWESPFASPRHPAVWCGPGLASMGRPSAPLIAKTASTDHAPARRLPPLLRRAWYGLNQAFRRRIAHLDLTPDQYTVLRNLHEAGRAGMTQSELTLHMTSDPNTIASLVERMEGAGLIRRHTDLKDRRARRLRLAPVGRRRFTVGLEVALSLQDEILSALPESERGRFLETLEAVADSCREAAERE
jgi:DNA-binding MarR family transcriptional regulator